MPNFVDFPFEMLRDCCLMQTQFFSYIKVRTSHFQWDDDEVRFLLDQHAELDFYSNSSLKQQSGVDMSLHSDTLFRFWANKSLLFLLNAACLTKKQQITILQSLVLYATLVWLNRGSNPRSTTLQISTLTITPLFFVP
jgi:hypothetical protein